MLVFIKSNYKVGDAIEITCTEGVVKGQIEYVNHRMIVVRQPNGQICGIAATDIHSFRAECPVPLVPTDIPVVHEPAPEAAEPDAAEPEPEDQSQPEAEATPEAPVRTAGLEPKVVGHIDLAQLQRIDPGLGRRKYFRKGEEKDTAEAAASEEPQSAEAGEAHAGQPFVPAKGRITFYHKEKKYGFIRDFATDKDHYFYVHQVAEPALFENLRKGQKVVYTTATNSQGLVARCVHFPHTVQDLLFMAEDQLANKRYQLALDMVEHILEVDEHNQSAADLLLTIKEQTPASPQREERPAADRPEQYNPNVVYMQAKKAYLAKDLPQAERLYLQAIDAGEKVESCVKDLVTLYVSNFKQATDADEREAWRAKATGFMESHRSLLSDSLTTKQFLALNFYLPLLAYDQFLEIVESILLDPQVSGVVSRRVFYLWQKAIALNKSGRAEAALSVIDEGLALAARNRQLLNLQRQILHPEESAPQVSATGDAEAALAESTADAEVPAEAEPAEEPAAADVAPAAEATEADSAPAEEAPAAEETEEA